MTFDERAYAVLFEDADESLLTEGEIYELYDTVTELIADLGHEIVQDYHFRNDFLPQKNVFLQ
jgi:hypothetical protein